MAASILAMQQALLRKQREAAEASAKLNAAARDQQFWNNLNPTIKAPPIVVENNRPIWRAPVIEGQPASDLERKDAMIDIFFRTGLIFIDAAVPNNFLKTANKDIVCMGRLRLEQEGDITPNFKFNQETINNYPQTVKTMKALQYIKLNRPDITDIRSLKSNPALFEECAKAYDDKRTQKIELSLREIKAYCTCQLERYINSRGSIDTDGKFEPSLKTQIFRNKLTTEKKVFAAKELCDAINEATSLTDIKTLLSDAKSDSSLTKSSFTSGMATMLDDCSRIVAAHKDLELVEDSGIKLKQV